MIKNTNCPVCGRYNIRKVVSFTAKGKARFYLECVKCHHRGREYPDNFIGVFMAYVAWEWRSFRAWKRGK